MIPAWSSKDFSVDFVEILQQNSSLLRLMIQESIPEMMLSLRFLTSKFRAQTLNEVQPFDPVLCKVSF